MTIEYQTALDIFESLQRQFPNLKMKLGREPKEVDLELLIPAQSGLDFPIELNLQNKDELHLVADVFWCEWFPCTDPDKVSEFATAVIGIISGSNRIEVHKRRGKPIKAILEQLNGDEWFAVATWGTLHLPFGRRSVEYVQNHSDT